MSAFAEILEWDLAEVDSASEAFGKRAAGLGEYSSTVSAAPALQTWTGASANQARALATTHAAHSDRIAAQARGLVEPLSDYSAGGRAIKQAAQNLVAEAASHGYAIGPDGSITATAPQKGFYAQTIARQLTDKAADLLGKDAQLHQNLADAINKALSPDVARAAGASSASAVNPAVPAKAYETLKKIDAGTWPGSAATGTHGGTVWQNREHQLASTDPNGKPIAYKEWDVNDKIPGQNRDAQRIITGSDGSAWYTGDHYQTFERMR